MTDPQRGAQAEVEAAHRFTVRLSLSVVGLALLLIGGGVAVAWAVNRPTEGVDLEDPPEYGPEDTIRLQRDGRGFSYLDTPADTINLSKVDRDVDEPIHRTAEIVLVFWTEDKPDLRHLLLADGESVLEVDGQRLVLVDSGFGDDTRVYVGPRTGRLVPVSREALSRGKAVSLPRPQDQEGQ